MTEGAELGNSFGNYLLHGIDEVVVPASISLMPQTIGWKIVAVLALAYICRHCFLAWRLWQRNWYRRAGLQVLAEIKSSVSAGAANTISEVPALLKSVALQAYPRTEIAQLSGKPWLDFLQAKLADKKFNGADTLLIVAYSPVASWQLSTQDIQVLLFSCENWIANHLIEEARL